MGLKPQTVALVSAGVAVTAGIAYLAYFDYKRRNDPSLKKKLKREKKKAAKAAKAAEVEAKQGTVKLIETVLEAASKETFPATPEEKEKYFMSQVAAGEALCNQGEAFYNDAVLPFYLALKVYPAPLELIMIYQKTIPEPVFQMVVNLMALEQQKRQNAFYEQFPPKESNVKLGELPVGTSPEGKTIVRRGLVADKDIAEGEVIYKEDPIVSALHPALEGSYCNLCLKKVDAETKVECANCDKVVFCSAECEKRANEEYHKYLCAKNKPTVSSEDQEPKEADEAEDANTEGKELAFVEFSKNKNRKYPYMIARFLATMVTEEMEKNKSGESSENTYNLWDHVDRFRYLDTKASADSEEEMEILKNLLGPKVQGISDFLTDEIYLMLKGKLLFNAYAVESAEDETVEVETSEEHMRATPSDKKSVGAALYKISTYLGQSEENPTVKLSFDGNNQVTVTALKDIKNGEELTAAYTLPVPK
ncbi:uncharacterized protein BYT42DRAFT_546835 [Radiomyces spectabilis]|uniref:uncharacterized protein n=1 Tax=Radiomyces spectabilis TaxID=64574 RepID=UPI0022205F2E|nr:uncharacterized protein BYT42DRAFT_546835 [Radiomyces spectabilis]KAI8376116.1 hypothetical protein BYT42DRAFT_546835 [Radiomyces spectabilis]